MAAGAEASAEETLRKALERHPDDTELLLAAADFYLRADAPDFWKPRLSLHYAMRADQTAGLSDPRATAAMVRAHRAAGGFEQTEELVREGLAAVQHPDAEEPHLVQPVDPDLIEPTLENILEQRRRDEARRRGVVCAEGLVAVPAGLYPTSGGDFEVDEFCVEEVGRVEFARCATLELRECRLAEAAVVSGPMAGLLRGGADAHRCCAVPLVSGATAAPGPVAPGPTTP